MLLAAERMSHTEIAEKVGTTHTPVIAWRARSAAAGIEGVVDLVVAVTRLWVAESVSS